MLEKTLESPLDCKEIQPVQPKENQSWIVIGRTDAEAEIPTLWAPDVKNWLIGKDPDAGKDWRQEEKMTEDEMVGWHHQFDGHEFEQALGASDGQGSLVCCSPCVIELDMTEWLNETELKLWKIKWRLWETTVYSKNSLHNTMLPRVFHYHILKYFDKQSQREQLWILLIYRLHWWLRW